MSPFDGEPAIPPMSRMPFTRAAHVTRLKLVNTRVFANPIEPRTSIAQYDAAADRFTWITPSQGVRYMLRVICDQVFKIPDERMRVLTYDVGGAFGCKEQPYPEDIALLHAARTLGRAVKWRGSRSENLLSDNHARDAVIECALALDADGRFLAIRLRCSPGWVHISAATAPTDRSATRPGDCRSSIERRSSMPKWSRS